MKTRFFITLMLLIASIWSVGAQVIIPPIGMATNPDWLSIDALTVDVTINNQIAETETTLKLTNNGEIMAEGTFLFPLPQGAAVERLTMTIDGQVIEAKILRADEARAIYDEIVRQYRDPALLEYVGRDVVQANVFPIPPKQTREVTIRYGQLLTTENGLLRYTFPVDAKNSGRLIKRMNIRVDVQDASTIGNVYSPTHAIAITRPQDTRFVASYEGVNILPESDFELFYGIQRDDITANLLTYKESAEQDGFFVLMVNPPQAIETSRIQPKDVVIVLDQSGSMGGTKWTQAQQATANVLEKLNPQDRFNVVVFSSGWRVFANELVPASQASEATAWVQTLYPEGGTNIHDALQTALGYAANSERPLTVLFMTDGVATEGIVNTADLLASLQKDAPANARIFTFGVGDDVDTFLLDAIIRDFRGTGVYVRPSQRVDEAVASLYAKISAPVLNDIALTFEGVTVEMLYPQQLPDLFAGEQLVLVGRYRRATPNAVMTLTGKRDGQTVTLTYDNLSFNERAGGQAFISRLWATRRIGDLLNQIRLNGENSELVESVVSLSLRYGIITPYTSFLIEEDDILSQSGRERAEQTFNQQAQELAQNNTGTRAVDAASFSQNLANASAPQQMPTQGNIVAPSAPMSQMGGNVGASDAFAGVEEARVAPQQRLQNVQNKTFILQGEVWTDTTYNPDNAVNVTQVVFLSDEYFDLLARNPDLAPYLSMGEQVVVVIGTQIFQVLPAN